MLQVWGDGEVSGNLLQRFLFVIEPQYSCGNTWQDSGLELAQQIRFKKLTLCVFIIIDSEPEYQEKKEDICHLPSAASEVSRREGSEQNEHKLSRVRNNSYCLVVIFVPLKSTN